MSALVAFGVGVWLGVSGGVLLMSVFIMAKGAEMTNEQRKALKVVRLRTLEHAVAARAGDMEDFELEELERSQAKAAWKALQVGCTVDQVVLAERSALGSLGVSEVAA